MPTRQTEVYHPPQNRCRFSFEECLRRFNSSLYASSLFSLSHRSVQNHPVVYPSCSSACLHRMIYVFLLLLTAFVILTPIWSWLFCGTYTSLWLPLELLPFRGYFC